MKYSKEEKLQIVLEVLRGCGLKPLCRKLHLDRHEVRYWVNLYRLYGEDGLQESSKSKSFSDEEKEKIVLEYLQENVTLLELSLRHGCHRKRILAWVKKYRAGGFVNTFKSTPQTPMARPKKKEPKTELERLQEENLLLRAENALLKKVKALVEQDRLRAQRGGRKPSTN
jgi:transposase